METPDKIMTKKLFEKAKFGDRFVTRGGQEALFLRLIENSEWQFADFYVKDWGFIRVNLENGKCLNDPDIERDIVGKTPSLPSELNEAAEEYLEQYNESEFGNGGDDWDDDIRITFKAGAEWMARQTKQEQQEVDLENEIEEYWIATGWSKSITLGKFKVIARYFYGLGQLYTK